MFHFFRGGAPQSIFKKASLDLNFALNKNLLSAKGESLVTFTRASSATYFDASGVMQTASTDVPRFDHNPLTGESLGLLVEEQRTNLLLRSDDYNTSWTKTRVTVSSDAIVAPNGALAADKIVEDTSTNTHFAAQSITPSASTTYVGSVFAKAGERAVLFLQFTFGGLNTFAYLNLSTGAISNVTGGGTFSATNVGNGWWRFVCVATTTTTGVGNFVNLLTPTAGTLSYAGDGTSGLYLWGAQLEVGACPTSYIPTTTAAATRSADAASITGSNFTGWYNATESTIFSSFRDSISVAAEYPFSIGDGTINNRISFFITSNSLNYRHIAAGVGTNPGNLTMTPTALTRAAMATKVGTNAAIGAAFGAVSTAASPAAMPTANIMYIGRDYAGTAGYLNGTISRLTYWPLRLPDPTLQKVTR